MNSGDHARRLRRQGAIPLVEHVLYGKASSPETMMSRPSVNSWPQYVAWEACREGARQSNGADVDRSYDLLALLAVCALTVDNLESTGDDQETMSGSLARCLKLAGILAASIHDLVELAKREALSTVASPFVAAI